MIEIRIDKVMASPLSEEEQKKQEKIVKNMKFTEEWNNLKVGYNPTTQAAFQVKYGSEIGLEINYIPNMLYNFDTLQLVNKTDHIYKCSQDNVNILNAKKNSEFASGSGKYWYGSLGTFELDSIEIGIVLLKANELVQNLADSVLGA